MNKTKYAEAGQDYNPGQLRLYTLYCKSYTYYGGDIQLLENIRTSAGWALETTKEEAEELGLVALKKERPNDAGHIVKAEEIPFMIIHSVIKSKLG